MSIQTNEQKMAQAAFGCVSARSKGEKFEDYKSFALAFPALVHSCGLAQALGFAESKDKKDYLNDLEKVLTDIEQKGICERSREVGLNEYTRLSRHVLTASTWLKRYCQAKGD
ncbi:MAG: CRISPR-associated protein Cmr5 [Fretibacterium sp.]|nr:CRISPR-associated protein Cmr5 [Fretibacterium sp.]